MSTSAKSGYHHGDLRASLLTTAMRMLEAGEQFSLRAVAREAGVSATAPYRHFADRDALESALAAQGLRDLKEDLAKGRELPASAEELAELAVAYVDFALRRPALFRLMFGNACDTGSEERVQAAADIHDLLRLAMTHVFSEPSDALASAGWALAHGLAYLFLDGKLQVESDDEIAEQVRASFAAILAARPK
ncbi:TetR family transcriptional regulator [Amycolatopsis keratiniphila subsp. nogabecina]|uniref:TetR family transcriptional regulator n=1 Tax=Amycolatopsis keratiniphila subsp. keratiniphila TaxID=227715 RepID=A0A1W2LYZ0_9PSEU|nr:TetR family transcriptional regulator [Amycolatopsis keratiniphila subsp. nogabecina]ONF72447.1 TetR family transcriptional regulator [Amycolatopsis keratiniphila subsp. keratiniphila]SDU70322.1 regulatory protein, tetR family [Amycolatopsis keratiniphila]